MLALQIGALLLTFSTAGWAAAILGGGSCVFFRHGRLSPVIRRSLKFILIGAFLIVLALLVIPHITHSVYSLVWLEKFETPWGGASFPTRLEAYRTAWELFRDKPLFGWGTNQLRIVGTGANNALLTVAAELGIFGLLIYLSMLGAIAKTLFSNVRLARSIDSHALTSMTAYIAGGIVALVAHSMLVDTNWNFFYWIGLALLYVNRRLLIRTK
jgi:O-antigen ligase